MSAPSPPAARNSRKRMDKPRPQTAREKTFWSSQKGRDDKAARQDQMLLALYNTEEEKKKAARAAARAARPAPRRPTTAPERRAAAAAAAAAAGGGSPAQSPSGLQPTPPAKPRSPKSAAVQAAVATGREEELDKKVQFSPAGLVPLGLAPPAGRTGSALRRPALQLLEDLDQETQTDMFFAAVKADDGETARQLLAMGVPSTVFRVDKLRGTTETARAAAVKNGKAKVLRAIDAFQACRRQDVVCKGLLAQTNALEGMFAKIIQDNQFKQLGRNPLGISRPWRNDELVAQCQRELIKLDVSQRKEIAAVLARRAQLFVSAHAFQNALMDFTAILELKAFVKTKSDESAGAQSAAHRSPSEEALLSGHAAEHAAAAKHEEEQAEFSCIKTLVNRGLVYKELRRPELALPDMEKAWRIFSAARQRTMVEDGKLLQPSTELDIAAHAINSIRFSLKMRSLTTGGRPSAQPTAAPATSTAGLLAAATAAAAAAPVRGLGFGAAAAGGGLPGSTPRWASLRKLVPPKKAQGVTLTWLIEWGLRNQIRGYGEWMVNCHKGKKLVKHMVETGVALNGASPGHSKSAHQLIQNTWAGNLSLSSG